MWVKNETSPAKAVPDRAGEGAETRRSFSKETGIPQSVLVRRAIDQILVRYGKLEAKKRKP